MENLKYSINQKKNISLERFTAFPNDEGEFMDLFYDEPRNKIKNPKLFLILFEN